MNNLDKSHVNQTRLGSSNEDTLWPHDQWLMKSVNYFLVFTFVAIYCYCSYPEHIPMSPGYSNKGL